MLYMYMKGDKKYKAEVARQFFEKGYVLQMSGHLDRAAHFYRRSIEFQPSAQAYTFLGWVYSLKGLYDEAIAECQKAIDVDHLYGNAYNDIGAYLIKLKRYREAIPWLKKALQAPRYENYCYPNLNLGIVYETLGDWDRALQYFRTAIEENPEHMPAQTALDKLSGKYN